MSLVQEWALGNTFDAIQRVAQPPYRTFVRHFLRPLRPVIIEGALDSWPALGKWEPEFFSAEWGQLELDIGGEHLTMADFVSRVRDPAARPSARSSGPGGSRRPRRPAGPLL